MKRALMVIVIVVFASCGVKGAPPQQPITIPSGPSAIPQDVSVKMDRQEQRLEDIDKRLALMEKTVGKLDSNVDELVRTNIIINFLVGSLKLLIPGLIIAAFSIWFGFWLKDRRQEKPLVPS